MESLQKTFAFPDVAVVYTFCDIESGNETTSLGILQGILAQLVHKRQDVSDATASLHHFESSQKRQAPLRAYENAIRAEVNRFSKAIFIIDGLDVLPDKEKIHYCLQRLPEQMQLFITLREADIPDQSTCLNFSPTSEDLHLYVRSRIEDDPDLKNMLKENAPSLSLVDEVSQIVVAKSHGL